MAPKKVEEPEKKPLIGRVGTNLKVGIVGIPNVGKSTFFNVLTKSQAAAENFPFCTIDPNENNGEMKISGEDEVPNKNAKIADIKIDTSIVAKRSLLSLIKGYDHYQESPNPSWHEAQKTLYPLANFYYACNTDTDPTERIADIIENSTAQQNFKSPTSDPYSEQEARTKYLNSKPVCYIIFGKPGLETERLAELIAASRNCVLISASKILQEYEERDDESAFRRNELQCGCDSTEDIVWTCIVNRVNERTVSHRGYVIEGLPILKNIKNLDKQNVSSTLSGMDETCTETVKPSEYVTVKMLDPDATEESSSTETPESSTDSNVSSIEACPEKFGSQTSVCTLLRKRSESLKHLSANASIDNTLICACSVDGSDGSKCEKCRPPFQLNQVFNEWKLKPDIIINITCPDDEILSKYKNSDSDIFSSTENVDKALDTSSEITDEISCRSITKLFKNANYCDKSKFSQINLKYDLCNYSQYVLKSIEKVICNHNPQNVICLDGRYPIDHLIEVIKIRLQILPLQNVILPERLVQAMDNFNSSDEGEEENEADESEEYENDSFENFDNDNLNLRRAFDKIKRSGIVSKNFEWKLSRWKFLCPVELAKGKKIEGKKKLAVRFMNWLFFLSSNEAMEDFIENPRPYLLPPNPRPCCRIVVIGPRYSGRTKLSFDLAKNLDSPVINVRDIITGLDLDSNSIDTPIDLEINDLMKSSRFSNSEIVNAIAENVENLPEQNCWDYFRNKGWILDNICLDYELCKKLLENDINVDTVVMIYESEPYSKLINHWKLLDEEKSCKSEKEEMSELKFDDFSDEYHEEVGELDKYIEELRYFNNNAEYVGNKLKDIGLDVVFCDLKFIDDLSDHAISHIWRDYQFEAKISEQDESEESVEEESQTTLSETALYSSQEKKHRLGDCYTYCPVALLEHDVLWKGKHRCLLDDKFYFLSNESTLNRFLTNHWKLPLPFQNPPRKIPSLKIIIIGPPGSGRSTLANLISKEYGLTHVDFSKCLEEYLRCRGIDVEQLKSRLAYSDHEQENYYEDSLEEVELPEDLHDLKYNVDKSTIINFFLKYKREGTPLPECIVNECFLNYYRAPFNNSGLVINSFPNYVEELEIILKHFVVPDVIIKLQCNYHNSEKRLLKLLLAKWQTAQDKKRREEYAKFTEEMENYYKKKRKWMNRERRRRYKCKKLDLDEYECDALEKSNTETSESSDFSGNSDFSVNLDISESLLSLDVDEEMELEETFTKLFPIPELYQYWESEEPVKEKFSMQIEEDYDKAKLNLSLIYNIFKSHNIPWIEIDANVDAHHVFLKALHILTPYARRNLSFFEKTYEIDNTTAESLLESGYYFLSSFGRFCPVQVYKRKNPFQMFLPLASQDKIFAVLHRQYVYFLAGKEALDEFKQQPLKYLNQDPQIPMIPAIISIIGPPKCGKTTLSNRFSSTYGFEVISRDEALNYVLNNFPWINLSSSVRKKFHNEEPASPDQLAAIVKLFLSNSQCVTQGCVFDGFPSTIEESQALTSLAINPVIVIDLQAPLLFTIECLENNETQTFSCSSHQEQYEEWKSDAEVFRAWLGNRLANIVKVDATVSKAGVWYKADEHVRLRFSKFVRYIRCAGYDKVHDLEYLCFTPNEIQCRLSCCKLFCPACFYFKKNFNAADLSKTRKGLVQFREYFYWYCEQHIRLYKCHPQRYLYLFKNLKWPNQYPQLIAAEVDLQNYCWASRLANNGYCIVTYIENLPARKLIHGKPNLSLIYLNRIYLFTTPIQRDKFIRDFPRYSSLRINFPRKLEPLVIKELPTLGFLEQSLAAYIVKAVSRVGEARPKLLGMSSSTSAAVFIGAYLKTYNKTEESKLYIAATERMLKRCNIMYDTIESMKNIVTPWIISEEEEEVVKLSDLTAHRKSSIEFLNTSTVKFRRTSPTQILMESDETRRVPVPDARYEYLCEYFKPASKVPAFLNVVDIAGLVKGAAEGQGLGNAFLSHISACDGIFHLCRAFEDDDVTHIEGDVNPVRDLEIINEELRLKDIEFLNGHLEKLEKLVVRGNDKKLKPEYDTLLKVKQVLVDDKNHIRFADWSLNDIEVLNKYLFLTSKPMIYLVNLSEKDYIRKKNKWLIKIKEWVDKNDPGAILIPFSGTFENKFIDMDEGERAKYVEESKVSSALDKVIVQGYKALQLQYFFTAGHDEVKAWTIQKGTKAPQAAGKIHTDFEKGFIMAEVMKYDDFKKEGSEAAVKAAGKYRQQGRNYVVEDGDIIFFKFNAGAGLKDAKKK